MSNNSQARSAMPIPSFVAVVTASSERLAAGVCPWCFCPGIRPAWSGAARILSCSSCSFRFGDTVSQPRDDTSIRRPGMTLAVSQALILELEILRVLEKQRQAVRERVLTLLQQGAEVEPGFLAARIEQTTRTNITQDLINEVCGPAALAEIKRRATGQVMNKVIIERPQPEFGQHMTAAHR